MAGTVDAADLRWAAEQIETYAERHAGYELYAQVLREVLGRVAAQVAPLAIVQARPKAIASFGEKIWRKRDTHDDPVNTFTDLCGGRVITLTAREVEAVSEFVEQHFEIDRENSTDVSERLQPAEFGYRSVHYIVSFRSGVFPNDAVDVEIPPELLEMPNARAEVQVRTILEHAWADVSHDLAYKSDFEVPASWRRELAALAAMLENADADFGRIADGLRAYAASYDAYMTEDEMLAEIEKLSLVLEHDPGNAALAGRIGKLAMVIGDWDGAIAVLSRFAGSGYQPLLRDLGVALCKRSEPGSAEYLEGQGHLERAAASPSRDVDALASLAGTWKGLDDERAGELYRRAFELDPTDPYAVGNYLEHQIAQRRDASFVPLLRPVVATAARRSRDQAGVGMNLPWAFYEAGRFALLLGEPDESLAAYSRAVAVSNAQWMVETSLRSLEALGVVRDALPGWEAAHKLLLLALEAKFRPAPAGPAAKPVVIVAGASDDDPLVADALRGFDGTVVSGVDPLDAWRDLVARGVDPSGVLVLGSGGGAGAAAEYRIALALGATVGLVDGSGGAASLLLEDDAWGSSKFLLRLPAEARTVRAFVWSALPRRPALLPPKLRETVGRAIHEHYRSKHGGRMPDDDPALADWDALPEGLRESNRQQADHIWSLLHEFGFAVRDASEGGGEPAELGADDVEHMAQREHRRWNLERLADGWTWGEQRDAGAKISPDLVPWGELTEDAREWDRETLREIPAYLARGGLELVRP